VCQSIDSQSRSPSSGPFTAAVPWRPTCPSVLEACVLALSAGPPDHVSTRSGPGRYPYPASYAGRPAEGPAIASRFPVAFRLPAFASWSSFARWGVEPSLRSAYRFHTSRTPTGLSRCARMRYGRGGCPLYPGDRGAHTAGAIGRPPHAAFQRQVPTPQVPRPITRAWTNEASIEGSQRSPVRPSPRL
jgi:hypothetical protein